MAGPAEVDAVPANASAAAAPSPSPAGVREPEHEDLETKAAAVQEQPSSSASKPDSPPNALEQVKALELERVHMSVWRGGRQRVRADLALDRVAFAATDGKGQSVSIAWGDVLGAHLLTANGERLAAPVHLETVDKTQSYLLAVFACPTRTHKPGTLKKRHLMEYFFRFSGESMAAAQSLQTYINWLADPRSLAQLKQASSLEEINPVERSPRKFLVLINPVGGSGKGVQLYETKVAPIFKFANIDATVKQTERANHALEIAKELPLGVYDAVVAVGGDGSLYEIVQGLMKREDWNKAIRQPIGIIPGGSGNGLAHSIAHQSEEKGKPTNAAFMLVKGLPHDLDITSMRNGKETTYSFLSLEWASVADVDIGSEKLRALGDLRFVVAYVHQILFLKKEYPGKLWYLDEDAYGGESPPRYFDVVDPESSTRPEMDLFSNTYPVTACGKWKEVGDHFRIVWVMNISHGAGDALLAPGAQFDDGYNYITLMHGEHSKMNLIAMLLSMETGEHMSKPGVQQIKTRAFKIQPERPDDLICVDGEVVDGPYLEAQVHRGMACIIAKPDWTIKK